MNKRNEKSSLDSVTIAAQALEAGDFIDFDTNRVSTGCSIRHIAGSNTVELLRQGLYLVIFSAEVEADAAGELTLQMVNNSIIIDGASATIDAAAATTYQVSFSTLIKVMPSNIFIDNNGHIQIGISAAGTVTNAHISVVKLA